MHTLLVVAQVVKIVAGLAQLAFGVWLVMSATRSALNVSLAAAVALNGIAFTLWNLVPAGQRTTTSFAFQGRALVNWFAAAAMLVFITVLLARLKRPAALLLGAVAGVAVLVADFLVLRQHNLSLSAFGGIATYPLTACILGCLAIAFSSPESALMEFSAFVSAALAINSVDHLGAEMISPSPTPFVAVVTQLAAMLLIVAFWVPGVWRGNHTLRRWALLVVTSFIVPFAVGLCVRLVAGSYLGFQQSGLVGVGRLVSVFLLVCGELRQQSAASCAANGRRDRYRPQATRASGSC